MTDLDWMSLARIAANKLYEFTTRAHRGEGEMIRISRQLNEAEIEEIAKQMRDVAEARGFFKP